MENSCSRNLNRPTNPARLITYFKGENAVWSTQRSYLPHKNSFFQSSSFQIRNKQVTLALDNPAIKLSRRNLLPEERNWIIFFSHGLHKSTDVSLKWWRNATNNPHNHFQIKVSSHCTPRTESSCTRWLDRRKPGFHEPIHQLLCSHRNT